MKGPSRAAGASGWVGLGGRGAYSRRCPVCDAGIGWRCRKVIGEKELFRAIPHDERKDKYRKREGER